MLEETERRIWGIVEARSPTVGSFSPEKLSMSLDEDGLGLDSVMVFEIIVEIENEFGIEIDEKWIEETRITIAALARLVEESREGVE